jgi:hypothetical protein
LLFSFLIYKLTRLDFVTTAIKEVQLVRAHIVLDQDCP